MDRIADKMLSLEPKPAADQAAERPREAPLEASPDVDEQTYYECGGGRKTFFALVFIILLPFFISLPVMLTQRVLAGVWLDTWGLAVIAAGFTLIMVLVLFELIFSLRAKVDIGTNAVAFTLPVRGGGLTPTLFYQSRTIPYDKIKTIQTYCDCYGGIVAPVVMRGVRLVLDTGERIPFGFVNEVDDDPRFPFPVIARQIARKANIPITNLGHVRHAFHRRMFGLAMVDKDELPRDEAADINRRHNIFLTTISVTLALLLALGIVADYWVMNEDTGERAATRTERVR